MKRGGIGNEPTAPAAARPPAAELTTIEVEIERHYTAKRRYLDHADNDAAADYLPTWTAKLAALTARRDEVKRNLKGAA